jgi:cell division protein FtsB
MLLKESNTQGSPAGRQRAVVGAGVDSPERERRYIYSGDTPPSVSGYAIRPNRRGTRRKVSTFNLIAFLLGFGLAIVVYVNNIITINRLVVEVSQLQKRYEEIQNTNATLKAEVNKKADWVRIGTMAGEQLGLRYANEQPVWFDIDQEKLEELKKR